MPSPSEQLSALAATQTEKRKQRAMTNREAFPGVASIVDGLTKVFGPVKVKWACENGRKIGKRDSWVSFERE